MAVTPVMSRAGRAGVLAAALCAVFLLALLLRGREADPKGSNLPPQDHGRSEVAAPDRDATEPETARKSEWSLGRPCPGSAFLLIGEGDGTLRHGWIDKDGNFTPDANSGPIAIDECYPLPNLRLISPSEVNEVLEPQTKEEWEATRQW